MSEEKQPYQLKPRIVPRHRIVLEKYKENGMSSMKQAIIEAGYAPSMSEKPKAITESKSWALLLQEHIPEELVAQRHSELLNKRDMEVVREVDQEATQKLAADLADRINDSDYDEDGESLEAQPHGGALKRRINQDIVVYKDVIYDSGPNVPAVTKALEMAYKLRGAFVADKPVVPPNVTYNLFYKPHVRESMKQFEDAIKATIIHESDTNNNKTDPVPVPEEGAVTIIPAPDAGSPGPAN